MMDIGFWDITVTLNGAYFTLLRFWLDLCFTLINMMLGIAGCPASVQLRLHKALAILSFPSDDRRT